MAAREAEKPPPDPIDPLFEDYMAARKQAQVNTMDLDREQFRQLIERQREQLMARGNYDDIRFRVAVEDGKVKLKVSGVRRRPSPAN